MKVKYLEKGWKWQDITSKGVKGHLPLILIAPGRITRPGFVNFPFHPLSLAASMSLFSSSPPSYIQQEKATISCKRKWWLNTLGNLSCGAHKQSIYSSLHHMKLTSSKRRCTEIYFPLLLALRSFILATNVSPKLKIGFENLRAS